MRESLSQHVVPNLISCGKLINKVVPFQVLPLPHLRSPALPRCVDQLVQSMDFKPNPTLEWHEGDYVFKRSNFISNLRLLR